MARKPIDHPATKGLSRRTLFKGLAAAGVATGILSGSADVSSAAASPTGWKAFDADVRAEFARQHLVGGAVAVVNSSGQVYSATLGHRSLGRRERVNADTYFRVGSTTKSMSSLLAATSVDQGALSWDQPVTSAWPGFRAPTDQLTTSLRVRDMFGMASGIGVPDGFDLHFGYPSAPQLLQSIVNLPVIAPPNTEFFYNNPVYAAGGYLPVLAQKNPPVDLTGAYNRLMAERVYGPSDMTGARIGDDPRGMVSNFATGNTLDLKGAARPVPFGAIGSSVPAGGTLATLKDMAAYVRLQLRGGVSVNGQRVVSAANLAECWKPHISTPVNKELDPDTVSSGYGMGWLNQTFNDGTSLVWHNGSIAGFTTFIGMLPERDIGLVVLNNMDTSGAGLLFYQYALNLLLSQRYGLNKGVPQKVQATYDASISTLRAAGRGARPVNRAAVAPWLGYYEVGYELLMNGLELQLVLGQRPFPLLALPNGNYIASGGLLVGTTVKLSRAVDGVPQIEIVGVETVRRTVGLD